MRIISSSRELTAIEKYCMTSDPEIVSLKDVEDGQILDIVATCVFEDEKEDGTVIITTLMCEDGKVYSTQSVTFIREYEKILEIVGNDQPVSVIKRKGTSKSGRDFIYCTMNKAAYK